MWTATCTLRRPARAPEPAAGLVGSTTQQIQGARLELGQQTEPGSWLGLLAAPTGSEDREWEGTAGHRMRASGLETEPGSMSRRPAAYDQSAEEEPDCEW